MQGSAARGAARGFVLSFSRTPGVSYADMMQMVDAARRYLARHPEELTRAMRNAFGLRVGVPLAALRWLGAQLEAQGTVSGLRIDAVPPGIRVSGHFDVMRTPVRGSATVYVDQIRVTADSIRLAIRLEDVDLALEGDADTPVAMLLKSRALDLTRPGDLVANLPRRPPAIVEARENRVVLDLMRDPKLAEHPLTRPLVGVVSSLVTLRSVETDPAHLDVAFRPLPNGLLGPAAAVRRHMVAPAIARLRALG